MGRRYSTVGTGREGVAVIARLFDLKYYIPSYGNLADLYAGGIVGCVSSLRLEYMFMTSLSLAVAFFVHYTGFSDDPDGILFNDRLTQIPLRKDIWDANNRLSRRVMPWLSHQRLREILLTNNIIHQLLDKDFTVVGVEFGNSFKQLCYLYPEIAIHIEYDQNQPLGINPFRSRRFTHDPRKGGDTGRTLPAFLAEQLDRPQSDCSLAEDAFPILL